MKQMRSFRRRFVFGLAAAVIAATAGASDARIWPAWSFAGQRTLPIEPGFTSLAGKWSFALPNGEGSMTPFAMNYDPAGQLFATGQFMSGGGEITIVRFAGAYSVDPTTHVQHVRLVDLVKNPKVSFLVKVPLFSFDGDVSEDGNVVAGTFTRKAGYFALPGDEAGPLTLTRSGAPGATAFQLAIHTRMDDHGRIFGAPVTTDGKTSEFKATATLYGTHFNEQFFELANSVTGGKIRGTVKTRANGTSTGLMTITGPKWKARFAGPVDAAGFHALCDLASGGFVVKKLPITLDVVPGPTPPTPPAGSKPPANLLTTVQATVVNGVVTLTASNMPTKFFGAPAGLRIEFPLTDWNNTVNGHAVVHADPSDASLPTPNARRCIVTVGSVVYGTATAPADVTFDVSKFTSISGGTIELLATGTVVSSTGKKKTVDVLCKATVQ